MKFGISYLDEGEWAAAGSIRGRGEAISFQSYYPFYRLTLPDEEGRSVYLDVDDTRLFVVGKSGEWQLIPWQKVKHQFLAHLPSLPFALSPVNKRNFFEYLQDHPLFTEWGVNENKAPSCLTLKPKKERVYFHLDAGELGKVKIEQISAECQVGLQERCSFEYLRASIEPKERRLLRDYYCTHISVDGTPCELMSWKEIQVLASKVQEKVFSLVVFQGWRGTELLFQTSTPGPVPGPVDEIVIDAEDSWGHKCPIQLQVVQSVYDSHPFIQASFEKKGKRWAVEQIYVAPVFPGQEPSLNDLKKIEQIDPRLECFQKIEKIQSLLKTEKVFILLNSEEKAPFLLIAPIEEKKIFFPSHASPASSPRCLGEAPAQEKKEMDFEAAGVAVQIPPPSKSIPLAKFASARKPQFTSESSPEKSPHLKGAKGIDPKPGAVGFQTPPYPKGFSLWPFASEIKSEGDYCLPLESVLSLQDEVISLLAEERFVHKPLSLKQRLKQEISESSYEQDYVAYLQRLKEIFSENRVIKKRSLRETALFIFTLQLRALLSRRRDTGGAPRLQVDELEEFLSKRTITVITARTTIAPPLSEREVALLCRGPKIERPLHESERKAIGTQEFIISFFTMLHMSRPLSSSEISYFCRDKEKQGLYIHRSPISPTLRSPEEERGAEGKRVSLGPSFERASKDSPHVRSPF